MRSHRLVGLFWILTLPIGSSCAGTSEPPHQTTPDARLDGFIQFGDATPDTGGGEGLPADTGPGPDLPPGACLAKTTDGIALNPGCDPDVQANGISTVDIVTLGGSTTWRVISGKKWWSYDVTSAAFTEGGKEIATFLKGLAPACTATTSDGIALNPGCDPNVQVNGVQAVGNVQTASGTAWVLTSGTKWWSLDSTKGAFSDGGKEFGSFMRNLPPDCSAKTTDGIALNAGCDVDVTSKGVTAIDILTLNNETSWLIMTGTKWWIFDVAKGAFTEGGKTIETFLKSLLPDCSSKTTDGMALNPGCDADVQVNGLSAVGSLTSGGTTVWFMTSGKKWWTFDLSKSAFTNGSGDVAAFFRTLKP